MSGVSFAADALRDDVDGPWSAAAAAQSTELPDFTPERRWTSALLAALGIVVLAGLVAAVITVAHRSSQPSEQAPVPAPPSTSTVASSPAMPAPSATTPPPAATAPPAHASVTATASTIVAPLPPSVVQPGAPQPNPGVRQRLHDLFPRLFPNP